MPDNLQQSARSAPAPAPVPTHPRKRRTAVNVKAAPNKFSKPVVSKPTTMGDGDGNGNGNDDGDGGNGEGEGDGDGSGNVGSVTGTFLCHNLSSHVGDS